MWRDAVAFTNGHVREADGTIWFTDPPYGIASDREGYEADSELGRCHVLRLDPASGALRSLSDWVEEPNGLAFSPDEQLLYVSDTSAALRTDGGGHHHIVAFDVLGGLDLALPHRAEHARRHSVTKAPSWTPSFIGCSRRSAVRSITRSQPGPFGTHAPWCWAGACCCRSAHWLRAIANHAVLARTARPQGLVACAPAGAVERHGRGAARPGVGLGPRRRHRRAGTLARWHHLAGWSVMGLGLFQVGFAPVRGSKGSPTDVRLRGDHYDMTPYRTWFERLHKSLGWLAVLALVAVIASGLVLVDAPRWMPVVLALWWAALTRPRGHGPSRQGGAGRDDRPARRLRGAGATRRRQLHAGSGRSGAADQGLKTQRLQPLAFPPQRRP